MIRLFPPIFLLLSAPVSAFPGAPDESVYRTWLRAPGQEARVRQFERYLTRFGVRDVLPMRQLLRTATDWRRCGTPFQVPPPILWARIVPSLRFIRDEIRPRIGPVEAVSGYRSPRLNACANGAPMSAHAGFWGVDLVPRAAITRRDLTRRLCALHRQKGRTAKLGLGFYAGLRFHVDTKSHRLWGANHRAGTSPCF